MTDKAQLRDEKAEAFTTSYINGNRTSVCRDVLASPNPAIMASLVTRKLCRLSFDDADTFIRILTSVLDVD